MATKKDYHKRLAAKLAAYKDIVAVVDKVGGGEDQLSKLLQE